MPTTNATEEHKLFSYQHQAKSTPSSSSPSIVTVHRATSIGLSRLDPRSNLSWAAQISSNTSNGIANFSRPVTPPESKRDPSAHSRSNSVSGARDGVGNLNRWSHSTTSSKGSAAHRRSSSLSRRMSFGEPGAFAIGVLRTQTANKPQKPRLPVGESPPGRIHLPITSSTSTASLPTLITLPALQKNSSDLSSPLTTATSTPLTAGVLSTAVHAAVPGYFSKAWGGSIPQGITKLESPMKDKTPIDPSPSTGSFTLRGEPVNSSLRHQQQGAETNLERGHSRNRSQVNKSSSSAIFSDKSRERASKQPSQKAMLSKALQKANTAVLLDNAQNFEGAMEAYSEACNLLQQVIDRSSGGEDKRKLEAIRNTYASRIKELEKITPQLHDDGKALPARPESIDCKDDDSRPRSDDEDSAVIETAIVTRIVDEQYLRNRPPGHFPASQLPQRRESLMAPSFDPISYQNSRILADPQKPQRPPLKSPIQGRAAENSMELAPPMESEYMPPPLSPRRPISPVVKDKSLSMDERQQIDFGQADSFLTASAGKAHRRMGSNESMSWLDTIDESGGSSSSSVHSKTSSLRIRRKHIRTASGGTEAEFDAALDAAVEAAYDDGFELMEEAEPGLGPGPVFGEYDDDDIVADVKRRVELARERVRQTERETAVQYTYDRERTRVLQDKVRHKNRNDDYEANESEEEERILEEMTRGYVMDDFEFDLQSKSALPRESDSSGFSGRTWNSSIGSNPTTAGTSLSTVTEASVVPQLPPFQPKTPHQLPVQVLLQPPVTGASEPPRISTLQSANAVAPQGVRSRRLSGQNAKLLKIETRSTITPPAPLTLPSSMPPQAPLSSITPPLQTAGIVTRSHQIYIGASGRPQIPQPGRQASSPFTSAGLSEVVSPPTPNLTQPFNIEGDTGALPPSSGSPGRAQSRSGLKKNFSSSSLKNRNLSVSNLDDGSDASPITPMSNQFGGNSTKDIAGRLPAMPALPTPIATAFKEKLNGIPTGGLYLFNSDINSPESPGYAGQLNSGAPIPLEPCPTESLLRPFWLMRALYQTIAHPRGGYLSTRLFVPRDVWRVKGVKLKNIEDKISSCDFLTAALQKLAKVDTCDADAVLEEMQTLESVLEQVQGTLTKKLGNDVGVQASGTLFRDAPAGEIDSNSIGSKASNGTGKSSFSWRRLRSKNSGIGLTNTYSTKFTNVDGPKEYLTMGSLPMTSLATIRFAKRDISQIQFSGPNANYMGALARLFDAAQVIDQIARQVEDPGLRHADKTQVGLELSTRHAAEFFGFYICRFVLTDISLLLDKFIKRGSEWVLI